MSDFEGFRWKETIAIVGGFLTIMGFVLSIIVPEMRDMRARIRALERTDAQQWCMINPETCMGIERQRSLP